MTLGRWLDMRGIQISSYPAKSRAATQRAKRPLDISKALVGGAAAAQDASGRGRLQQFGCAATAAAQAASALHAS